jgi:hypothetical protein
MYRNYGGDWAAKGVAREMKTGVPKFVVNTGDVVWWGAQGRTVQDSPYWQRVNNLLSKHLPSPDAQMKAAGLKGRYFMSMGNHEVLDDPQIDGVLSVAPYLKKLGVSPEKLTYKFDFGGARFIFLWTTGKTDHFAPSGWDSTRPACTGTASRRSRRTTTTTSASSRARRIGGLSASSIDSLTGSAQVATLTGSRVLDGEQRTQEVPASNAVGSSTAFASCPTRPAARSRRQEARTVFQTRSTTSAMP